MIARVIAWALATSACGGAAEMLPRDPPIEGARDRSTSTSTSADARRSVAIAGDTASPTPRMIASDEAAAIKACGAPDARLDAAADELARRQLSGDRDLSKTSEVSRLAGEPHPWPRVWLGAAPEMTWSDVAPRVAKWKEEMPRTIGERRCGRAMRKESGNTVAIFVSVDALADMAPLPTRARPGTWLTLEGKMLVPAASARVMLVGPDGKPRAVPTQLDANGVVRARFTPDRAGRFAVQLLADVGQGPRPVLEALVFADVEPFEESSSAPGEAEGATGKADAETLGRMINALRAELGLGQLRRDAELDALARQHAERMKALGKVGHDVGDGDPKARIERAGVQLRKAGENVAHAESLVHAHRALYASPSHRENLVHRDFDRMGLGVVVGEDGTVWVAELFGR